jgi:hypothetical protein
MSGRSARRSARVGSLLPRWRVASPRPEVCSPVDTSRPRDPVASAPFTDRSHSCRSCQRSNRSRPCTLGRDRRRMAGRIAAERSIRARNHPPRSNTILLPLYPIVSNRRVLTRSPLSHRTPPNLGRFGAQRTGYMTRHPRRIENYRPLRPTRAGNRSMGLHNSHHRTRRRRHHAPGKSSMLNHTPAPRRRSRPPKAQRNIRHLS